MRAPIAMSLFKSYRCKKKSTGLFSPGMFISVNCRPVPGIPGAWTGRVISVIPAFVSKKTSICLTLGRARSVRSAGTVKRPVSPATMAAQPCVAWSLTTNTIGKATRHWLFVAKNQLFMNYMSADLPGILRQK